MKPTNPNQPKIIQTRILRTAAVLFVAAGAIFAYVWYSRASREDSAPVNTKGYILAIRTDNQGSRAVLVKPDGSTVDSPATDTAVDDREAAWRPDGNRIYISRSITGSKDPELSNYQIYRWKPDEDKVERRTIGTRALAHPRFSSADSGAADPKALATAGGRVLLFDPLQDSSIHQILPPTSKEAVLTSSDQGDSSSDFDAFYKGLGTSFREARWSADKSYIIAVMRRDNGEALIVQKTEPTTEEERKPYFVACADHIDFDVHPTKNMIVYASLNFQWQDPDHIPETYRKGGKVSRPYNHALAYLDLDKLIARDHAAQGPIDYSKNDAKAFAQPCYSPDGEGIVVVSGAFKAGGEFVPEALMFYPAMGGPSGVVSPGVVSDPAWSPDGETLAYVRAQPNGQHDLVSISRSGGAERVIVSGKGNFSHPLFSPQK